MPSGNSSSRRRRGPKPAHCPRGSIRATTPSKKSAISITSSATSTTNRSSSSEATSSATSVSSVRSIGSVISVGAECNVMAPEMTINDGDRKSIYELTDKGKLVVINRTDGTLIYMLRCVDGRRVYIEKGKEGASLMLSNQKGKIIKVIAGEY